MLLAPVLVFVTWALIAHRSDSVRPHSRSEVFSIIKSATSIEAYRVKGNGSFGSETIGNYSVVGKGLTPDRETVKQLKVTFVSHLRSKANPMGQKGCPPPEPGVAIRFIQGAKSIDILLCLKCYDLMVMNYASPEWRDFYYPAAERDALVKITKALFPGDTEIQSVSVLSAVLNNSSILLLSIEKGHLDVFSGVFQIILPLSSSAAVLNGKV
jgi:hypothetical protein